MSEPASWPTGVKEVMTQLMQATTPGNTVVQTTVAGQRDQRPPSGACTPIGLKSHRRACTNRAKTFSVFVMVSELAAHREASPGQPRAEPVRRSGVGPSDGHHSAMGHALRGSMEVDG